MVSGRDGPGFRCASSRLHLLSGAVAAEANHAKSRTLQKRLDAVYRKITDMLRSYDDGLFSDSLPR